MVWAVAKGSALNKLILVPTALVISALCPWAVLPLLMLGGLYLCFEGVERSRTACCTPRPKTMRIIRSWCKPSTMPPSISWPSSAKDPRRRAHRLHPVG